MLIGGLLIFYFGFEFGFGVDAVSFLLSAVLIAVVPFSSTGKKKEKERARLLYGIQRMFAVSGLRRSLMLSLQVSIVGGLAIVTTAGYVKNELKMEEAFYPVAMAVMGIGAMAASLYYVRCDSNTQKLWGNLILPAFLIILGVCLYEWFSYKVSQTSLVFTEVGPTVKFYVLRSRTFNIRENFHSLCSLMSSWKYSHHPQLS